MPHPIDASFTFRGTKEFTDVLKNLPTDKASQQALRKAARKFVQVARRGAPVGDASDANRGALKKSVSQSRRVKKVGLGTFVVNAGPMSRGRVRLYRGQAEQKRGFVATAYAESAAAAEEAFTETYKRVLSRGRL